MFVLGIDPGLSRCGYACLEALRGGTARLAGLEGVELRCRVGLVRGLWFVAGIVGPERRVNPFAWMQNKRTLDVLTGSLQFGVTED